MVLVRVPGWVWAQASDLAVVRMVRVADWAKVLGRVSALLLEPAWDLVAALASERELAQALAPAWV